MAAAIRPAVNRRQSLPRVWLVTDERLGDGLFPAIDRLPQGAGILFRHYRLPEEERRKLFATVRQRAQAADQMLLLAGPPDVAAGWGADGWHGWHEGRGLRSASVHDLRELRRAEAGGAQLLFVSPLFATRSHPGVAALGPRRFAALASRARRPVIALGGVKEKHLALVQRLGGYGWAGIDAWLR